MAAASSARRSTPRNAASAVMMRNGIETKVAATIAPPVVNGSRQPVSSYSQRPANPLRPKA